MANITIEELALEVALLRRKLDKLTPTKWVGVADFAASSGLSPAQIRHKIKQSIKYPADSQLRNGTHYLCSQPGKRAGKIMINGELFSEAIGMN